MCSLDTYLDMIEDVSWRSIMGPEGKVWIREGKQMSSYT